VGGSDEEDVEVGGEEWSCIGKDKLYLRSV
jgi:hypothetical protein